jgi:hypothetical protein
MNRDGAQRQQEGRVAPSGVSRHVNVSQEVVVREADLDSDRALLISLMSRNLPRRTDGPIFDWLYRGNPQGPARVWIVHRVSLDVVIGAAAAFPRRMCVNGSQATGWVLGDFFIDRKHRSLGPALQLQSACLEVTKSSSGLFCYDFPSAGMLAVYKRLGVEVTGRMLRLAKLLRVDRKLREFVHIPIVQPIFSAVTNALFTIATRKPLTDPSLEFCVHEGQYDGEFSILAEKQCGGFGVCIQRSAEYLNWRYRNNPLATHECVTAHRHGKLVGYVIYAQVGEDAVVVDLFGEEDQAMIKGLLVDVSSRLTNRGVMTLSVWLNEFHPWLSWYSEMGFRLRDSAPIVCVPAPSFAGTMNIRNMKWFLMQGDRDS